MLWFEGEISTAINISKSRKSLFVVFVKSIEEDECVWNEDSIEEIVKTNKCICLKLMANSQLSRQFSQIYPLIVYPTIYFIGINGEPLVVKVGSASVEELEKCFTMAIKLHENNISLENNITQASCSNTFGDPVEYLSSNIEIQNFVVGEKTKLIEDYFDESIADEAEVIEERIPKKMCNDDKAKREPERELKKEKKSDLKANDQIKKEIGFNKEHVRIQFKLPDGSSTINTFFISDHLASAKSFILQRLSNPHNGVTLTTMHPKITFKDEDYKKTFAELNLAPSAVLIVLPKEPPSRSGNIFIYLFYQFLMLYHYLASLIFPTRFGSLHNNSENHSESTGTEASQSYGGARPKVTNNQNQSLRQRREGKVHRFTANDEDDEHATWNGNSTQQM